MNSDAEPGDLNLAARLQDGQKLIIPDSTADLAQRSVEIPGQPGSVKVNVNTATQAMLEELPAHRRDQSPADHCLPRRKRLVYIH